MRLPETIRVVATHIEDMTPIVKSFVLAPVEGGVLPPFSGGSHVVVTLRDGAQVYRNPYSLSGSPRERASYRITVRKHQPSRGGSRFLHECVTVGTQLEITPPRNLFPMPHLAKKQILIAGGIGITPFLPQLEELNRGTLPFELHYTYRTSEQGAFAEDLVREYGRHVFRYVTSRGARLNPENLLRQQPLGTHVSVCGPVGLIEGVYAAAAIHGWPRSHIHCERFTSFAGGSPFTAVLARSGREVQVPQDASLLDALENAGLEPPYLCRGGACGSCEAGVLEGEVEHRDHYLSANEQQRNRRMMICVSRARSNRIVLDL